MIAKYLRRAPAEDAEAHSYNVMQRTAYLTVIFVLFPLVIWTGLAMSPAFTSAVPAVVTVLGGRQTARTLHFFLSWALVLFLVVHVTMIVLAGFWSRMRAMITGACCRRRSMPCWRALPRGSADEGARMKPISRRKLLTGGLAATAGVAGLTVAARLAERYGLIPPDCGGVYGPGTTLTYAAQRILTAHSLAREFPRSMISKSPFANSYPAADGCL